MDKYDKLLEDIIKKTRHDEMKWELDSLDYYEKIIFHYSFTANVYSSKLIKNEQEFEVVFVEKHIPEDEWGGKPQRYWPELYFLTDNGTAFILDQRYVEINRLTTLADLIKEHNISSRSLFY